MHNNIVQAAVPRLMDLLTERLQLQDLPALQQHSGHDSNKV